MQSFFLTNNQNNTTANKKNGKLYNASNFHE